MTSVSQMMKNQKQQNGNDPSSSGKINILVDAINSAKMW